MIIPDLTQLRKSVRYNRARGADNIKRLSEQLWLVAERTKQEFLVERHAFTSVTIYEVTADDLEQLERETLTISEDFSFASVGLAIAATLTVSLLVSTVKNDRVFQLLCLSTIVGYICALFFGIRWWRGRRQFQRVSHRIRQRGGPLGQEGKELAPTELARLTPQTETETLDQVRQVVETEKQ